MAKLILPELSKQNLTPFYWNIWINYHHHMNFSPIVLLEGILASLTTSISSSSNPDVPRLSIVSLTVDSSHFSQRKTSQPSCISKEGGTLMKIYVPFFFGPMDCLKSYFFLHARSSNSSFGKPATLSTLIVKEQIMNHPKCTCPTELSLIQLIWHLIK